MENQALHRVFNVFLLGLAAECYLFIVQRFYTASTVSSLLLWDRILRWGVWLGLVMLVAGLVVAVVKRNQAKLRTAMTWVAGIGAFLAVSGWVITRFFDQNRGITAMCIAVPVLTLLGLVYFLFQHECFATTVILTGSLFSVWVCGNGVSGTWRVPVIVCAVLVVIALVVLAGLIRRVQTEGGKLGGLRVFTPRVRLPGALRRLRRGGPVHRGDPAAPRRVLLPAVGAGHPAFRRAGVLHHQADVRAASI